jgi:hypothetical protein
MKNVKSIEIKDFNENTKFKVGDKILFLTGACNKEQIELNNLGLDGLWTVNFKNTKDMIVEEIPLLYYCIVDKLDEKGEIGSVQLIRDAKFEGSDEKGTKYKIREWDKEFINLFTPYALKWNNGNIYPTFVMGTQPLPYTVLAGIVSYWDYTDEDLVEFIK